MHEFHYKTAVITGAASGIGLALTEEGARRGMNLVLADIDSESLGRVEAAFKSRDVPTRAVVTDVARSDSVQALAHATYQSFGPVHLLCNNAGVVAFSTRPLWLQPEADWRWQVEVNVMGVLHGLQAFVPSMIAHGQEAHILNTSSLVGLIPGTGSYAVTKHAVVALSESLQFDLVKAGARIGVSVLCPGGVRTRILESDRNRTDQLGASKPGRSAEETAQWEAMRAVFAQATPPEDIAACSFAAIESGQFYVRPHRDWDTWISRRCEAILAGQAPEFPPM